MDRADQNLPIEKHEHILTSLHFLPILNFGIVVLIFYFEVICGRFQWIASKLYMLKTDLPVELRLEYLSYVEKLRAATIAGAIIAICISYVSLKARLWNRGVLLAILFFSVLSLIFAIGGT